MKYLLEGQDIGVFSPKDLEAMQTAFTILSMQLSLFSDDEEARKLAKSLIQLYRHGVRDPEQLVAALIDYKAA
jgi:flagellin-specific chaperone FliS